MKRIAKKFEFVSYKWNAKIGQAVFKYKIIFKNSAPMEFTDTLILPQTVKPKDNITLDKILHNLHLMLGISYYKLYVPEKIKLNEPISKEQAGFFNIVYRKGLGEFCFDNNLDPDKIAKFPYKKINNPQPNQSVKNNQANNRILVGIAGGKDSIVASEILKEQGEEITGFIVDTQGGDTMQIPDRIAKMMGIKSIKIRHILDKKIFQNLEGSFSGHVPFSAIVAFIGLFTAFLYDFSYVAAANEYSANFGNMVYKGEIINHQWSKASEFENLLQGYVKKFITQDIIYFSPLRPFYEIRIAEMFSKYKKYFPYFTSCNENFKKVSKLGKNNLWCGKCPKCVFIFTMFSTFLSKKELQEIFNKNLFDDKELFPIFNYLLGFGKLKPFDCVGTFEEMRVAFYMAAKKHKNAAAIKKYLPDVIKNLPPGTVKEVFKTNPAPSIPERFRFLGIKSALILGYGKEGKTTHQYLKNKYPSLKISISDKKLWKNPDQKNFDLIIKTPGIKKSEVSRPCTTATNIFFSEIEKLKRAGKKIITIGITGSKGKSTTSSLIYEILKEAGKNVQLVGNIGNPMLSALMNPLAGDEIFVIELSSYQLDDIKFSPDIAVVLNLFPEHMNYHGGVEEYYKAKRNIINFQNERGFFIFNPKDKKLALWEKNSKSQTFPFILQISIDKNSIPLIGEHNKANLKAAATVAKLLKIPDKIIAAAIKKFTPLPHRLEFIGEYKGIKFYDDAISTTPESAIMAIRALKNVRTIFLGGEDRGYDFSKLEKTLKKYKISNIVLFPDSGRRIIEKRSDFNILETDNMKDAVKFAFEHTPVGSICLLSPASPSYSLWKNFEERGGEFQKTVKLTYEDNKI
ncbi:MAG: UDP-N-acetylmuramoyl-L-alanine--D-glutamate ligase [bacterium]